MLWVLLQLRRQSTAQTHHLVYVPLSGSLSPSPNRTAVIQTHTCKRTDTRGHVRPCHSASLARWGWAHAEGGGRKSVEEQQTPPRFHFTAALINSNVPEPKGGDQNEGRRRGFDTLMDPFIKSWGRLTPGKVAPVWKSGRRRWPRSVLLNLRQMGYLNPVLFC